MNNDIQVRLATVGDEPKLGHFLHNYWRANHPLSLNPWLLRWQHGFPGTGVNKCLTFMVAHRVGDESMDSILGVLGFIPFRRYDPAADWSEIALALWKARADANAPGLGLRLHDAVIKLCQPELVCVLGTTEPVRPLYRLLGYQQDVLAHAALFATSGRPSAVARSVPTEAYAPLAADPGIEWLDYRSELDAGNLSSGQIDEMAAANSPRKSSGYVRLRYLEHPCYDYQVRLVRTEGLPKALVVWRRVEAPPGPVLRIVDIVGDADVIRRCGANLRLEVEKARCEYIDVMYFGIGADVFRSAGFVSADDHPQLVLPSHFSPFKPANVKTGIAYRYDTRRVGNRKLRLFRADSDQDRPNENIRIEPRSTYCR